MIRVVVDTNVFVSSFFGGNPKKIIQLWEKGKIILCLSKPIVDEYIKVLIRMGLQNDSELEELLSLFANGTNSLFTSRAPKLYIIEKDPDDNKFIECAVALNCKFIISGDKHLKSIEEYLGIKIITPREFLDFLSP